MVIKLLLVLIHSHVSLALRWTSRREAQRLLTMCSFYMPSTADHPHAPARWSVKTERSYLDGHDTQLPRALDSATDVQLYYGQ